MDIKKKTYQEQLTDEAIEKLLEDYVEVEADKISQIPIKSHLRYYTLKEENGNIKKLFRMGGQLVNKDHYEDYLMLSNGKNSWSVQTNSAIFYKKMKIEEIKEYYKDLLEEKDKKIKKLQDKLQDKVQDKVQDKLKNKLKNK